MNMKLDKYKAFFFDFDGVISDSVNIKTEAFSELYKPYGKEACAYVVRHHKQHGGMSRFLKFKHYHKHLLNYELSENEIRILADQFSELVLLKVIKTPFIKGALEFIRMLSKMNKLMFIVSGTPEHEIKTIVNKRHLNKYFLEVKGSPEKKDKNIKDLLEKYNISSEEAVFFGDSQQDLNAALLVGIDFVPINFYNKDIKGYKDFIDFTHTFSPKTRMRT